MADGEQKGAKEAVREDVRNMRETVSRDGLESKLEDVVEERPATRSFLEPRPVLIAVAIAAVLTLIALLLFSPQLAAVVLVLSFFVAWFALSRRDYEQRRPTRDANAEEGAQAA
jgi:Flp pilus assembly protein TadB